MPYLHLADIAVGECVIRDKGCCHGFELILSVSVEGSVTVIGAAVCLDLEGWHAKLLMLALNESCSAVETDVTKRRTVIK